MIRLFAFALVLAGVAQAQTPDTLTVRLEAAPGHGPFERRSVFGVRAATPVRGLPDTLDVQVYEDSVWVPYTGAATVLAWAVGQATDSTWVAWVDTDHDRDFADETGRSYPPIRSIREVLRAREAVVADTATVRLGEHAVTVTVWPSFYNYVAGGRPRTDSLGRPWHNAYIGLHHRGTVTVGESTYQVVLGRSSWAGLPYSTDNARFTITRGTSDSEPLVFQIDDTIRLGGEAYRLAHVEPSGAAVTLVRMDRPSGGGLQLGQRAPDFSATGLDGTTVRLADFRGRYVLLEFWATWCGPCWAYAPRLAQLRADYPEGRLAMVGIAADDAAAVHDFVEQFGHTWPQVVEPVMGPHPVLDLYRVQALPATFLLDPDGRIVYRSDSGGSVFSAVRDRLGAP